MEVACVSRFHEHLALHGPNGTLVAGVINATEHAQRLLSGEDADLSDLSGRHGERSRLQLLLKEIKKNKKHKKTNQN